MDPASTTPATLLHIFAIPTTGTPYSRAVGPSPHQSSQSSHERPCVLRPFIHESESPPWPTHLDSDTLQEDSCSAVLSKRPWNQPFESRVDSSSGPCTAAHACTVQRPCADALQQAASWPCSPPSHQPPANQHSNSSVAPRSGHGATRTTRAGRSRGVD